VRSILRLAACLLYGPGCCRHELRVTTASHWS
jgi:hypothetical protein